MVRPAVAHHGREPDRPSHRGRGSNPPKSGELPSSLPTQPIRLDDRRDDRAIVDAVLAGDRDAYRVLVEREGASVVRACHRVLGDLHEAEDAAQEAFVIAYRSLASWRGDGPFGAWLTRIAVRIALRQAGKRRAVTWLDPVTARRRLDGRSRRRGRDRRLDGRGGSDGSVAHRRPLRAGDRRPQPRSPRCPSHIARS